MKTIITIVALLMLTGCGGIYYPKQVNHLPDTLQIGRNLLSRDTVEQEDYPVLDEEQLIGLTHKITLDVPDGTQLIGERPVKKGVTLDAYKVPTGENPNQFKVFLVTRSDKGVVIDWIDLRDFHTSEHQGPMRLGGNRFYTTDATVTFDDATHFTLHRMMTLTSIFLKDHSLTEAWRVEWDNHFEIDSNGRFLFKEQQEITRIPSDVDNPFIEEYKSRDRQLSK